MVVPEFWDLSNILGFIALITGTIYVILAAFRFRICWVFGGISSLCLIYNLWNVHYYVDSVINMYNVVMAFYAWIYWKTNSPVLDLESKPQLNFHIIAIGAIFFGSMILGFFLNLYTQTPHPYADACIGVISVFATWLSARKILQNWLYWIAANSIAVIIYFAEMLYFEAILMGVYAVVALFGYYEWNRIIMGAKKYA